MDSSFSAECSGRFSAAHVGAAPAASAAHAGHPLGTNDGFCFHPSESGFSEAQASAVDLTTGELLDAHWGHRLKRWELQASARELLPESRLRVCYRHRQKKNDFVRVYRRGEGEKASTYYRGLQVCGSVWSCPVCASKITERKRQELVKVIEQHVKRGGRRDAPDADGSPYAGRSGLSSR